MILYQRDLELTKNTIFIARAIDENEANAAMEFVSQGITTKDTTETDPWYKKVSRGHSNGEKKKNGVDQDGPVQQQIFNGMKVKVAAADFEIMMH